MYRQAFIQLWLSDYIVNVETYLISELCLEDIIYEVALAPRHKF